MVFFTSINDIAIDTLDLTKDLTKTVKYIFISTMRGKLEIDGIRARWSERNRLTKKSISIICSRGTADILIKVYRVNAENIIIVNDGDQRTIGGYSLRFFNNRSYFDSLGMFLETGGKGYLYLGGGILPSNSLTSRPIRSKSFEEIRVSGKYVGGDFFSCERSRSNILRKPPKRRECKEKITRLCDSLKGLLSSTYRSVHIVVATSQNGKNEVLRLLKENFDCRVHASKKYQRVVNASVSDYDRKKIFFEPSYKGAKHKIKIQQVFVGNSIEAFAKYLKEDLATSKVLVVGIMPSHVSLGEFGYAEKLTLIEKRKLIYATPYADFCTSGQLWQSLHSLRFNRVLSASGVDLTRFIKKDDYEVIEMPLSEDVTQTGVKNVLKDNPADIPQRRKPKKYTGAPMLVTEAEKRKRYSTSYSTPSFVTEPSNKKRKKGRKRKNFAKIKKNYYKK